MQLAVSGHPVVAATLAAVAPLSRKQSAGRHAFLRTQRTSRCERTSMTVRAQWQQQDPQQRDPRSGGRRLIDPEVLPRDPGSRQGGQQSRGPQPRPGWDWPPPPPPPPPPPFRRRQKVGQLLGSRRELLASLAFVGAVVLGFQAIDPLRDQPADEQEGAFGNRGMPSVQYTAEGVIVRRITDGSAMKVVSGKQPGQLLLLDLQSGELYEMRLGLDSQVDPYQRDLMNLIFLNPGWELMLKPAPPANFR